MQPDNGRSSPPTLLQLLLFAFPALPHAFVALPLNIVIPAFFASHTSVTLLQIAWVTTVSRLLDVPLDLSMGYLSDRTKTRIGRRKPWVLAGAFVCAISIFFLFQPPPTANFVYYGVWSFLLYFGFTLFEIPRQAWTAEISRDYIQRSRINTWVAIFNVAGSLVFWLMPLALMQFTGTTAITGAAMSGIAWLYAALMPAGILLAVLFVPTGTAMVEQLATLREIWHSLRTNRVLWRYYTAMAAWGLGQGCYLAVIIIFLSDYMKLAEYFPFLMIAFFAVQIVAMPFWQRAIVRYGKHRVWVFSLVFDACTRPLILLFAPGGAAIMPLFVLGAFSAFLNAPANIAPSAILGDVVDYDLMKSRVNKAGNVFAFNTLLIKATMAVGSGAAFFMLGVFNYQMGRTNTAGANAGLLIAYLVFPALMYFVTSALAWNFPIDARRHNIIRRKIERRSVVAAAAAG
jgi:GPH family glycoside/pentoside/hexuronide:cation symporter